MSCLSLGWLQQLCVDIVVIVALVSIIKILIPWLLSLVGATWGPLGAIINIVLWAIVVIFIIYVAFALLGCLMGAGGFHIGSFR